MATALIGPARMAVTKAVPIVTRSLSTKAVVSNAAASTANPQNKPKSKSIIAFSIFNGLIPGPWTIPLMIIFIFIFAYYFQFSWKASFVSAYIAQAVLMSSIFYVSNTIVLGFLFGM